MNFKFITAPVERETAHQMWVNPAQNNGVFVADWKTFRHILIEGDRVKEITSDFAVSDFDDQTISYPDTTMLIEVLALESA